LNSQAMLERGFSRVFGSRSARDSARVALACDRFPFSGYPRWEINSRWDVVSRHEPIQAYRKERRFFAGLARRARRTPAPLRASVELRHYLAARDVYVRAGGTKPSAEKALRSARAMWQRTRDARVRSPNEEILRADAKRLRQPRSVGWQLCYRVKNFAPAAQLVAVEQQRDDGTWETVQACHTIEFQSVAARPSGGLTRTHAAPVRWDGNVEALPRLRFALRGIGAVRLEEVALRRGSASLKGRLTRTLLGRPAPGGGFPKLEWTENSDELPVRLVYTGENKKRVASDRR
jgi:hypothetical protein